MTRKEHINTLLRENFTLWEMVKILMNKKNLLTDENLDLLTAAVEKFADRGVPFDDLMDIGTIGVIKAVQGYDAAQHGELAARITACVNQEIEEFFAQEKAEASSE